ncbi:MAG: hypothetical protein BWY59_00270 [Verrucomicrobia bacterium ADurb.Bin345]|nr:MAG: hypothetical protein BWY59_00270 [Verrucomicrobia bacterium ADurb.Bin345]
MPEATFMGVNPPARITGFGESETSWRLTDQSCVLPVAPQAPVTGSYVSVMNPSTCGAKCRTSCLSASRLPARTTRLLMKTISGQNIRIRSISRIGMSPCSCTVVTLSFLQSVRMASAV